MPFKNTKPYAVVVDGEVIAPAKSATADTEPESAPAESTPKPKRKRAATTEGEQS